MKLPQYHFIGTVIGVILAAATAYAAPARPNILFIFADDMGDETIGATFAHAYNMACGSACHRNDFSMENKQFEGRMDYAENNNVFW